MSKLAGTSGQTGADVGSFANRMLRAAKLDVHLYEEVEADTAATPQAMAVVILASVAAGIGIGQTSVGSIVIGTLAALVGWVVWAALIYWIGTRLFPEPQTRANVGELLRTIGFANSPGVLRVLGGIPGLGPIVLLAAGIWVLVATVIAVRQALDYHGTWRAVGVCILGWVIQGVLLAIALAFAGGAS